MSGEILQGQDHIFCLRKAWCNGDCVWRYNLILRRHGVFGCFDKVISGIRFHHQLFGWEASSVSVLLTFPFSALLTFPFQSFSLFLFKPSFLLFHPGKKVNCGDHTASSCKACPQVNWGIVTSILYLSQTKSDFKEREKLHFFAICYLVQGNGRHWCNGECQPLFSNGFYVGCGWVLSVFTHTNDTKDAGGRAMSHIGHIGPILDVSWGY